MSHTAFLYHIVWRTYRSVPAITEEHERLLYAFVLAFCNARNCYLFRINSVPDHVHILVSISPQLSVSEFMKVLKVESNKWLKENRDKFPYFDGWGNGYAGFSYSIKDKDTIIEYITRQKEHHRIKTFREEYRDFLIENGMEPDDIIFFKDE